MSESNGRKPTPPPSERMAHWINHRWSVLVRKERGDPPPWTNDRIMQDFRFCNVHRGKTTALHVGFVTIGGMITLVSIIWFRPSSSLVCLTYRVHSLELDSPMSGMLTA